MSLSHLSEPAGAPRRSRPGFALACGLLLGAATVGCSSPGGVSEAQRLGSSSSGTAEAVKPGDRDRGQRLFVTLPCAGCHGAMAGGQFGPTLAGTSLALSAVEEQVRRPRDKMPPFGEAVVSEDDLRDIYAWITSLPQPQAAAAVEKAPAAATVAALDRRFPELDAMALGLMMDRLDEVSLRVTGEVVELDRAGRFSRARLRVGDGPQAMDLLASFDTTLAGGPFPAEVGDVVVAYGVGADPAEDSDGTLLPRMQILELEVRPS